MNMNPRLQRGFTLMELLLVTAIIIILAGMLLPVLAKAKEKGRMVTCINNLRQIGLNVFMYMEDYHSRYPTVSTNLGGFGGFQFGGGDPAPEARNTYGLEWATNRPLCDYSGKSKVYDCPADRGYTMLACMPRPPFRTLHEWVGTSYKYNFRPWNNAQLNAKDPEFGCAGKRGTWTTEPWRFILFDEIAAEPYKGAGTGSFYGWCYFFWHEARGPSTVTARSKITDNFISPSVFADGHAGRIDFTQAITKGRLNLPCEQMPDWYFYETRR